jgi:selenocysteine-specific elongation factor
MIIGTAGHIDHGKTTLVRALTGVDTDRLKEEKTRGISIELGYAYTPLSNGDVLGFIDVPGHERLIRTMVAGACGIDFALLVVAADDGVMPQTREHVEILELLGVRQGAVALTKVDRVDERRAREVHAELRAFLAGTPLRNVPIFALDAAAPDHPGTAALRRHLHDVAVRSPARAHDGLFRLAVDRVFTLPGHGTVAAGTVFSGKVHVGDTVVVMPSNTPVRVRSIHAQNRPAAAGCAGQRCAVNLAGIHKNAISRGGWLADARALAPTTRIDVRLKLLADRGTHLEAWSPLHIHLGACDRVAHVVPLESDRVAPGQSSLVQLVVDAPICAAAGDRFVARDGRAAHTVGGGVVLDPFAPSRKRRAAERLAFLAALECMLAGEGIAPVLEHARYGMRMSDLARLTGCASDRIPLPAETRLVEVGRDAFVVRSAHWHSLRERAVAGLRAFHVNAPDEPGPDVARLRRIALPDLPDPLWHTMVDELVREQVVKRAGTWLHLPSHSIQLSEDDHRLLTKLQPLLVAGRFDPPWVRELASTVCEPEERVRQVLRKAATQGTVFQVVRDLFYDRECTRELAGVIATLADSGHGVSAARFRDTVDLGRKRAIQILEFFDRVGYTRRVHDAHVLRPDGWKAYAPGGAAGPQTQKGAPDASW